MDLSIEERTSQKSEIIWFTERFSGANRVVIWICNNFQNNHFDYESNQNF